MATVEEPRTFIRPDGKEKVTGAGRYTADLNLTGQLHAKFRYADHTHARITRIDTSQGARAARRARRPHARGRPGRALRRHGEGPAAVREGQGALRGRHRRRRRGDDARDRGAGRCADRGRVRAAARRDRLRGGARRRRAARPRGLGVLRARRRARPRRQRARLLDDREGRRRRGDGGGRRRRQGPLRHRPRRRACRSSRARSSRSGRATGSRSGRRRRCRSPRAPASRTCSRSPSSHVRVVVPLLGGGFGSKCDFHFEGHVAALARAARTARSSSSSRASEEFVALGHRREGMVIELETGARRDGTLVARAARLVLDKGAYCGEGGFFAQMAAMHALRPVRDRERPRRVVARLHEQPAVLLDPRPDGAAGVLGARAAHGRARRRARPRPGRAAPAHADRGGRRQPPPARCSSASAMKETLERRSS